MSHGTPIRLLLLIAACLAVFSPAIRGQTLREFRQLNTKNGLPDNTVYSAYRDTAGYMWLATVNGISRWDGYEFKTFHLFSLYGDIVLPGPPTWVGEGIDGEILFGGQVGIIRFDYSGEKDGPLGASVEDQPAIEDAPGVTGAYEAGSEKGVLWVGTYGKGLFRWDRNIDSVTVLLANAEDSLSLPSDYVSMPFEDSDGTLWIPTQAGLSRLNRSDMSFQKVTDGFVIAVTEDPENPGVLWLSERDRLSRFAPSSGSYEVLLQYEDVREIVPGSEWYRSDAGAGSIIWDRTSPGVLWIAANTAGLYRFDTNSGDTERYIPDQALAERGVSIASGASCVIQDRSGILWICTLGAGVSFVDPSIGRATAVSTGEFPHPHSPDFPTGWVSAVAEDSKGRWWVGTHDGARRQLLMIDRATGEERRWDGFRSETTRESGLFGEIHSILEDRHGDIWLGEIMVLNPDTAESNVGLTDWGHGAAYRMRDGGRTFDVFRHDPNEPHSLPDGGIVSLYEDEDGFIWVGTRNHGIARIDPESGRIVIVNIADHSNSSWGFLEDHAGRVWVGTHDGICLLDRVALTCESFNFPVHHAYNSVELAERPSEPGVLWVSTWYGLFRFDTTSRTFTRPVSRGPLIDLRIMDIISGENSFLWITTDGNGAFRFDPDSGALTPVEFDRMHFSMGAGMLTSQGEIVLGSWGAGLRVFDSRRAFSNSTPPNVLLTQVSGPKTGVVDLVASRSREVRLKAAREDFTVEYVGLHYSNADKNEYAYKLEGMHDDWQYVGSTRRASFGHLGPGTYTFRVKAASSYGVWNEKGATLSIVVPPTWWQTTWARIVFVLLVLGILLAGERFRHAAIVRRERQRAALRETQIRSEVAEAKAVQAAEHARQVERLDEARSRFFANVSHEFRTPLTLILGVGEDIAGGRFGQLSKALRKAVQLMVENARKVDGLVRELLDLSRLESGTLSLTTTPADLEALIREVVRSHTPLAERARVGLHYRSPATHLMAKVDVEKIKTAVGNLVSNAIKFTEPGGEVEVSLRVSEGARGDRARIEVRDTGVGIRDDDLPHVFERFSQVDTSATRKTAGIGLGLALVKELVELHGGQVEARSELGAGSTFSIHLPLGQVGDLDSTGYPKVVSAESDEEVGDLEEHGIGSESPADLQDADRVAPDRALVLIVEDNADVRTFLRDHFEPDFQVLEAQDGLEGLRLTQDSRPDLVISDVMMPEMDGIELCRAIKADPDLRNTPVILVTARAGETEVLKGLEAGADEYVTKPFSVAVLVQLAHNVLKSRDQLRSDSERTLTIEPTGIKVESDSEDLLRRVLSVTEDHLGDSYFTVDLLADEVGLSRRQLERRIPEICGETPSELVRRMRLERARQLLEADVGTVSEISYAAGYRSGSRFASAFRKAYGASPSEYRRSLHDD